MLRQLRSFLSAEGEGRDLISLFFPVLLFSFSSYFFLFIEKLFLARVSVEVLDAAISVVGVCQIFQASMVSLVMMLQVHVGRWSGAGDHKQIGPGVWQLIWFSFLSMLVTVPCSLWYGSAYFQGTFIESLALPYFYFFVATNFLYPLSATFTCFYFGQGKKLFVVVATLISQVLKLCFAYIFIFGVGEWIPAYGLLGGAVSTLIAQLGFCGVLFYKFFSQKNHTLFNTREWRFHPRLFWECIHPGLLRMFNRLSNFFCWAETARLMIGRGESYALVLSIGTSLFLFLEFLASAICQANITVVSQLLGAKKYEALKKSVYPVTVLSLILTIPFAAVLFFFPTALCHYLFPTVAFSSLEITAIFNGLGFCFLFFTMGFIPTSYVLVFKDMRFILWMGAVSWIIFYLPIYIALEFFQMSPAQFWFIRGLGLGLSMFFYYLRMRKLCAYPERFVLQKV